MAFTTANVSTKDTAPRATEDARKWPQTGVLGLNLLFHPTYLCQ